MRDIHHYCYARYVKEYTPSAGRQVIRCFLRRNTTRKHGSIGPVPDETIQQPHPHTPVKFCKCKLHVDEFSDIHSGPGRSVPGSPMYQTAVACRNFSPSRLKMVHSAGSPPPSSLPNGGPPPLLPEDDTRQPAPPAQGEDPSFDAKVAAEFFRLRDAKASLRDNDCGRGGTQGAAPPPPPPPPPGAFESDVERAMRELEVEAGLAKSASGKSRYSPPTSRPPASPPPAPAAASARPDLSDGRAGGDEGSSLLSHMDMRRVSPGGGKGRPGGLRGMWDNGGGSEGHSALYGAEKQQQQTQRHGPGLKGMWGGEQPEESARPKRQGPGLRGLWSGPDMAAADAARSESQAAYMSALNRDAQEKRAFSDDPQGQQQRLHHHQRQQARVDQDGQQYSPYSEAGGKTNGASEPGTSLVGIGTPRGGITPRQQRRREYFEGADGVDSFDRAADRAKKAAYAEELRKQMAEKEARMAMDEHAPASGRRRASTGGRRIGGGSSGGAGAGHDDGYNHAPSTPASRGRESYPGHGAPDSNGGSPFTPADGANDRWPSAAWSTPPPDSSGSNAGEGRVTAARRRLVEDVYGGGGMGAALGGAGYRRASTGTHGVRSASAGSPGDTGPEQVGVGGRGESTAFEGADGAASQGGSSYLRTGAGVQNLRESERSENKLQKRAAALEQQRALEAQIAARARAKKEEEDKRKREEEEEARCATPWRSCACSCTLLSRQVAFTNGCRCGVLKFANEGIFVAFFFFKFDRIIVEGFVSVGSTYPTMTTFMTTCVRPGNSGSSNAGWKRTPRKVGGGNRPSNRSSWRACIDSRKQPYAKNVAAAAVT